MRRARATSRIDEEEDLQYILEEMSEGEKEGGVGASVGGRTDSHSRKTSSTSGPQETKSKDGDSKVLLSPPATKVRCSSAHRWGLCIPVSLLELH